MTSSTKQEVHNVSQRRQRRTETRTQATWTKDLVKFGHVVFGICWRTDTQTHIHALYNTPLRPSTAGGVEKSEGVYHWSHVRVAPVILTCLYFRSWTYGTRLHSVLWYALPLFIQPHWSWGWLQCISY